MSRRVGGQWAEDLYADVSLPLGDLKAPSPGDFPGMVDEGWGALEGE